MNSRSVVPVLLLVLAAAGGCGKDSAGSLPPERTGPEVPKVKAAVETLLRAKDAPDGEEQLKRVVTPELYQRFVARPGALKTRPKSAMKFDVKDVEVWGKTATARASVTYPDAPDAKFLLLYELVQAADGWKVSSYDLRGDFGEDKIR